MPKSSNQPYIPALGAHWLTPLYDPLLRRIMREDQFKRQLIRQASLQPGQRVLDLGCGTGTLVIQTKKAQPQAEVVGLDPDPEVLAIARAKARKANVAITFEQGMAHALPYPDRSFERVLTSLVLHHLRLAQKERAAQEVFRVLKPGGQLHVADFGKPHNLYGRLTALVMGRFAEVSANIQGQLPQIFERAGFVQVEERTRFTTLFGTLSLYRAQKP